MTTKQKNVKNRINQMKRACKSLTPKEMVTRGLHTIRLKVNNSHRMKRYGLNITELFLLFSLLLPYNGGSKSETSVVRLSFFPDWISSVFAHPAREAVQRTPPERYDLFSDGKTGYDIFISTDASESEIWAANELQHWLTEISGAPFRVREYAPDATLPQTGKRIYVGYSEALREKTGDGEPDFHDESFRYFNRASEIYIYGGKQRGTMYGVFSFLENELGCRWYTPEVKHIPSKREYLFSSFNRKESPGILVRNDFFYTAFDPVWAARNKMNGTMGSNPVHQPGGSESYWAVHTFYYFLPPSEFFDTHPEYYSLVAGKRTADPDNPDWGKRGQLCLSNPDVQRIMIRRVKDFIREHPEHKIYSVSQNDWQNPCQCDKCREIANKYGGKESGILIWFVNRVAEAVEKEFPDKFIGTLAYQYTRSAPLKIQPRHNVIVRLCPIEACVAHPLESCPKNESFVKDLKDWSAIAPHLYIWDYVVNFQRYIMPYPNFAVLQPNMKTFAGNKAIGVMEQGSYQERGGEFQELKAYLIAKLLWNPDCDTEQVTDDFFFGYYGRSGQYLKQYFHLLQNAVTPETHIYIGLKADDPLFSDELVVASIEILNKAAVVADNETIRRRVQLATLPILYLKCLRMPAKARNDGSFDRFLDILKRENIERIAEYRDNLEDFKKYVLSAQ